MVAKNRKYLRVIIECVMYTAQQNIAQRGHKECRSNLASMSDNNRGNFLELLHLRCKDNPWLAEMLERMLGNHKQWTSPGIQNELLQIMSDVVRERILKDVRASRNEQVSLCLSYVVGLKEKRHSLGFFRTKSTTGEVLYELLCNVMKELNLDMSKIVAECFDGASNMKGENKALATRMKVTSPMPMYIHCYGYLINLALQYTLENVPVVPNILGIIQSLYNFLEASPKRHAIFEGFGKDEGKSEPLSTLKSQSVTRWSCRWVAVKAVYGQLDRIVGCLLEFSAAKDSKTYSDARALLKSVLDCVF